MRIIGAPAKQANPRTANKTLRPVSKALTPEFLDELEGLFRKYGHLGTRTAITRAIVRDGTVPYADRIITEGLLLLSRKGRIKLPKRTGFGGKRPHKKKR